MNDDINERRDLRKFLKKQVRAQRHCLRNNVGKVFEKQEDAQR